MTSNTNIHNSRVALTEHACKRARQRLSWNAATLERMSKKAFESGLKRKNTNGLLKKYLDHLWNEHKYANNLRLYGETLFVFSNHRLLTVWHLPPDLRTLAKVFHSKIAKTKLPD
jgi:hypothetical protein